MDGSALKVCVLGGVVDKPIMFSLSTLVEVELGCKNYQRERKKSVKGESVLGKNSSMMSKYQFEFEFVLRNLRDHIFVLG